MSRKREITYFAKTNSRGQDTEFGIKDEDRLRHVYLIGKTGMGKSTLFENMAVQDINKGNGLCFIDPHGSAVETFLEYIPENRIDDVIYFCPSDIENPIAFNVMDNSELTDSTRFLVAQGLLAAFKKVFGEESFSDRMVHILNNTLLALLEYPGSTILSITRMLTDPGYEEEVVSNITDPAVKFFWVNEYGNWEDRYKKEANAAILNKLGQFNSNPLIRNVVGQEKNSMDFREIMDGKKILLINLSKGQIGEDNANLLGAMITTKIYLAAMSRADLSKSELISRPNFYLYIDEFQNVVNDSFANILSEARKYKLSLLMAHQYIEQMPETVRAAIFGNVGTTISFRIGPEDGEIIEKLFSPTFYADDIINLGRFEIYLSLMIDGIGSQPFSAITLPPILKPDIDFSDEVIASSREKYGTHKKEVVELVNGWLEKKYQSNKQKKKQEKNQTKWAEKKSSPNWVERNKNSKKIDSGQGVQPDIKKNDKNFSFKDENNFGLIKNKEQNDSLKEALSKLNLPNLSLKKEDVKKEDVRKGKVISEYKKEEKKEDVKKDEVVHKKEDVKKEDVRKEKVISEHKNKEKNNSLKEALSKLNLPNLSLKKEDAKKDEVVHKKEDIETEEFEKKEEKRVYEDTFKDSQIDQESENLNFSSSNYGGNEENKEFFETWKKDGEIADKVYDKQWMEDNILEKDD